MTEIKTKSIDKANKPTVRERLVAAGFDEAEAVGFERFSVRRVATTCGVSCAAPYKHFKNKREFLEAIVRSVVDVWLERQKRLLDRFKDEPIRRRLVELALDYIRFLVENPRYRAILMINDKTSDDGYLRIKGKISELSKELIRDYRVEVGMSEKDAKVKMYVVRSLIYGASIMFGNGEIPYDEPTFARVAATIEREFDLP